MAKGYKKMSDGKNYVAPPNDPTIVRMFKIIWLHIGNFFRQIRIAFKTPYRRLTPGLRVLKFIIQLVIVAAILFIAYIIISIIIGIIIAILVLFALGAAAGGNEEIEHTDEWGNKKRYRRY